MLHLLRCSKLSQAIRNYGGPARLHLPLPYIWSNIWFNDLGGCCTGPIIDDELCLRNIQDARSEPFFACLALYWIVPESGT